MPPLAMVSHHDEPAETDTTDHPTDPCCFHEVELLPSSTETIKESSDHEGSKTDAIDAPNTRVLYIESLKDIASSTSSSSTSSDTSIDDDCSQEQHSCSLQPLLLPDDNKHLASHVNAALCLDKIDPTKDAQTGGSNASYLALRSTYLLVTLVIMLADGLQGTHLYVLYESYGFSVASLYCLGFTTGGLLSPFTGPLVDKMGRKKAAILYCVLEILINMMEQYPFLSGLIVSRMIGGFTTNLLHSVFETWLDTEYRKRGFAKAKYEVIMRDSVIVSNLAAIFSGYLAHILAEHYGPIGPFRGAVSCTTIALVVVCFVWSENYGTSSKTTEHGGAPSRNMVEYFAEAATAFRNDSKMLRIGLLQGLTEGSIQIFVFLWSPTLRHYALKAPLGSMGLNRGGEPAYGLIFGAYMFVGVLGGVVAPYLRTLVGRALTRSNCFRSEMSAVECVTAGCYFFSAMMLFVPSLCSDEKSWSFTASLVALMTFELLIGIFLPFEGVIRSHYFPVDARASIMGMPRIIVNAAVAVGVVSTEFISMNTAFAAIGVLMLFSSGLQLSLIPIWGPSRAKMSSMRRSISDLAVEACPALQRLSILSDVSAMPVQDMTEPTSCKSKTE